MIQSDIVPQYMTRLNYKREVEITREKKESEKERKDVKRKDTRHLYRRQVSDLDLHDSGLDEIKAGAGHHYVSPSTGIELKKQTNKTNKHTQTLNKSSASEAPPASQGPQLRVSRHPLFYALHPG